MSGELEGQFRKVADLADSLIDAIWAKQEVWQAPEYREIHVAMLKTEMALEELEKIGGYTRQENRSALEE